MKLNVILIENDEEYANMLLRYVVRNNQEDIKLTICSSLKKAYECVEERIENIDLVLVSEGLAYQEKVGFDNYMILKENDYDIKGNEKKEIFKYASGENIVSEIFRAVSNQKNKVKTKIITVYSPNGGTGKTFVSTRLAGYLSKSKKVFYLNLESITDFTEYFKLMEGKNSITSALYQVEQENATIITKEYIVKQEENIDTFIPPENALDMLEMDSKRIRLLIKKIKKMGYDYIVIDMDSKFDKTLLAVLEETDKLLLIKTKEGTIKLEKFRKYLSTLNQREEYEAKITEFGFCRNTISRDLKELMNV